jgi:hypothetical protein
MIDICDWWWDLLSTARINNEFVHNIEMHEQYHLWELLDYSAFNFPVAVWAWNTALA